MYKDVLTALEDRYTMGRFGCAEKIAEMCLASEKALFVTAAILRCKR